MSKYKPEGGKTIILMGNNPRFGKGDALAKFVKEKGVDIVEAVNELSKAVELCDYCGNRPAFKTNGQAKHECVNRANTGDCERPYVKPAKEQPRTSTKVKRNTLCFCGSGKKFKHCHLKQMQ